MLFKSASKKRTRQDRRRRSLRVESLENRRVLAGLVLVEFDPGNGLLTLTGDVNSNEVTIAESFEQPGDSFLISAGGSTRLSLDPVFGRTEVSEVPITNVKDIVINFQQGGSDEVNFIGAAPGVMSELEGTLDILTSGESEITLTDWEVQELNISQTAAAGTERTLTRVVVVGETTMTSVGGEAITKIEASQLDGVVRILNGDGDDDLQIIDTRIGGGVERPGPAEDYLPTVLIVDNAVVDADDDDIDDDDGDDLDFSRGRSSTTIRSSAGDLVASTIHGEAMITNGVGFDIVMIEGIEVTGGLMIDNGDGDAAGGATVMIDSGAIIGSDLINGNGLEIENGDRRDVLMIDDAILPSGMLVDNRDTDDAGNDVNITASTIGGNPLYGNAIQIINGEGNDSLVIADNTTLNGLVDLGLGGGNDDVTLTDSTINGVLSIGAAAFVQDFAFDSFDGFLDADDSDGAGRDVVIMDNLTVTGGTFIDLGDDVDTVRITGGTRLSILGVIDAGGSFADTLELVAGLQLRQDLLGFEFTSLV